MPLGMAWEEIVDSELGIIIIRAEDCRIVLNYVRS